MKVNRGLCRVLIVGLMFASEQLHAGYDEVEDQSNPLGCKDVGYQYDLRVLELMPEAVHQRDSLYFMFNKLNVPLNLYQMPEKDSTISLYLNSKLLPGQWSVLSTGENYLKFICTVDNGQPYGKVVDCADSIKVCEFANVKYGLNNHGNLWIVKNNSKNGALRDVNHYGIIAR